MSSRKLTIFMIGHSDNSMTSYLLNCFVKHGIAIEGVIFDKNYIWRNWKRFKHKVRMRGLSDALRRGAENMLVHKREISRICRQNRIRVYLVDDFNSEAGRDILISNRVDLLILSSTTIIKKILLDIKGLTIINAHTGWLPKYRGLDANLKALRNGHRPGVSVHRVTKKIDGGEVYLREKFDISFSGDILAQMDEKELQLSGKLLVEAVHLFSHNKLRPIAQDEPLGKYEPPLAKEGGDEIIKNLKRTLN